MTFPQKKALVSTACTLILGAVYFLLIDQLHEINSVIAHQPLLSWPLVLLSAVPVLIVLRVIVPVVASIFHTVSTRGREDPNVEVDPIVHLKAVRNSFYSSLIGFLAALLSLLMGHSISVFFSILLITLFVTNTVADLSEYYFQKGSKRK